MHWLPTRENYTSEDNKCTLFVILKLKTLISIVYRPQKNIQIILNVIWTFIIIYNFIWQHFRLQHMAHIQHLTLYFPNYFLFIQNFFRTCFYNAYGVCIQDCWSFCIFFGFCEKNNFEMNLVHLSCITIFRI